jgi:hypothetical protein
MTTVILCVLLSAPFTAPARVHARMSEVDAWQAAEKTPDRWFISPYGFYAGTMLQLKPDEAYDLRRKAWDVSFRTKEGRRVLWVQIDDRTGAIVRHTITDGDWIEPSPTEVVDLVRTDPELQRYLDNNHHLAGFDLRYDLDRRLWKATVRFADGPPGVFEIDHGRVRGDGPWTVPTGAADLLRQTLAVLRPDFGMNRGTVYLYALALFFLFVDVRRIISWRTWDLLALMLLAPAALIADEMPTEAGFLLSVAGGALLVHLVWRGIGKRSTRVSMHGTGVYLAAAVLVIAHQGLAALDGASLGRTGFLDGLLSLSAAAEHVVVWGFHLGVLVVLCGILHLIGFRRRAVLHMAAAYLMIAALLGYLAWSQSRGNGLLPAPSASLSAILPLCIVPAFFLPLHHREKALGSDAGAAHSEEDE